MGQWPGARLVDGLGRATRVGGYACSSLLTAVTLAHGMASGEASDAMGRAIVFPDTAEHQTLVVDLHTHSVFSDGHVWPVIRVGEAVRDGLDAIAITEHLEWQPHIADIKNPDRNRAYAEAVAAVGEHDLIVIPGSEITRRGDAGHMNAVFITDANKLLKREGEQTDDPSAFFAMANNWPVQEVVQAANDQGAFVFWNHPYWMDSGDGVARMNEFHRKNARGGLLHGIEIANGDNYSEEAFKIALDHKLALIGVSDVHNLIEWDYPSARPADEGGHRPVTLVFAKERTAEGIRDALKALRTVVWFKNLLIGRPTELNALLAASLTASAALHVESGNATVRLTNHSAADFQLRNTSRYTFGETADLVTVPAHATRRLWVKTLGAKKRIKLEFEVLNALRSPKQHPRLSLDIVVQADAEADEGN